jgi:hypothetical protein
MVRKDVKAIGSAIESMKAFNWANKNEIIKQLEENLDAQYDDIPKGRDSTGYEEAQRLIKSSNWNESEKERVLKLLSEINDAEQVEKDNISCALPDVKNFVAAFSYIFEDEARLLVSCIAQG